MMLSHTLPLRPNNERWILFTQTALVCLEQNPLSGYCQVSSRLTTMAFYDTQTFPRKFPRKHSNTSRIRKSYSGWSRAHLAVSIEWVLSQTNESCLCESSSPFTMGLNGSQYHYIIYVYSTICYLPTSSEFSCPRSSNTSIGSVRTWAQCTQKPMNSSMKSAVSTLFWFIPCD